jgi:hypothetical protein
MLVTHDHKSETADRWLNGANQGTDEGSREDHGKAAATDARQQSSHHGCLLNTESEFFVNILRGMRHIVIAIFTFMCFKPVWSLPS